MRSSFGVVTAAFSSSGGGCSCGGRLVLFAFDELDAVLDQMGVEVLDLLFRELDLLEPVDDLVVGEKALLLPFGDELLKFLDLRERRDVDGEQVSTSGLSVDA